MYNLQLAEDVSARQEAGHGDGSVLPIQGWGHNLDTWQCDPGSQTPCHDALPAWQLCDPYPCVYIYVRVLNAPAVCYRLTDLLQESEHQPQTWLHREFAEDDDATIYLSTTTSSPSTVVLSATAFTRWERWCPHCGKVRDSKHAGELFLLPVQCNLVNVTVSLAGQAPAAQLVTDSYGSGAR